jgi:indole-3-glycerol phosphate synthase
LNILDTIIARKQIEVNEKKALSPTLALEKSLYFKTPCVSFSEYIKRPDKLGIVAEFKRKSPSKPSINLYADSKEVSIGYMQSGASAISVLTDESFFGGSNEDLITVRRYNYAPILRKDFIIDEYQIVEAKSIGADAILLIAEILTINQIIQFTKIAQSLGLEVLLELHSKSQIDKIIPEINVLGINNRNLTSFVTDIQFSIDLIDLLPKEMVKISESGIKSAKEAAYLKKAGYDGFLIGEQFMKNHSPAEACKDFILDLNAYLS